MGTNHNTTTVQVDIFHARGGYRRYEPIPRFGNLVDARWTFEDGVTIRYRDNTAQREADKKARVYVSTGANFDLIEDLTNRTRRPHQAYRAGVLDALARLGIEDVKINWSQGAGCSMCPCSPGFIITGGPRGGEFWIELPGAPAVDEDKPARELVVA